MQRALNQQQQILSVGNCVKDGKGSEAERRRRVSERRERVGWGVGC